MSPLSRPKLIGLITVVGIILVVVWLTLKKGREIGQPPTGLKAIHVPPGCIAGMESLFERRQPPRPVPGPRWLAVSDRRSPRLQDSNQGGAGFGGQGIADLALSPGWVGAGMDEWGWFR